MKRIREEREVMRMRRVRKLCTSDQIKFYFLFIPIAVFLIFLSFYFYSTLSSHLIQSLLFHFIISFFSFLFHFINFHFIISSYRLISPSLPFPFPSLVHSYFLLSLSSSPLTLTLLFLSPFLFFFLSLLFSSHSKFGYIYQCSSIPTHITRIIIYLITYLTKSINQSI